MATSNKRPSLADVLATTALKHPGPRCSIGKTLESLDADDADEMRTVLASEDIPHSVVTEALRTWLGTYFDQSTISRHRRGHCRCSA